MFVDPEGSSNVALNTEPTQYKYVAIVIGLAIILIGLGYWFVYRPYMIRRKCAAVATNVADYGHSSEIVSQWFGESYQGDYQLCLNSRGLE